MKVKERVVKDRVAQEKAVWQEDIWEGISILVKAGQRKIGTPKMNLHKILDITNKFPFLLLY